MSGKKDSLNQRILFISDMHVPFQHKDTFDFLKALAQKYMPTRVVCLGDEIDNHAISFHSSDPDLPSAGDELSAAIQHLKRLYKLFPKMDVIDSNHGSLAARRFLEHGLPKKLLRSYGDILEAPSGWVWSHDLTLKLPNGKPLYVHHGLSKDPMKVVAARATCFIQGHYHEDLKIGFHGNPEDLLWGATAGCLIDPKSLAFAYNKTNLKRPIIGTIMVIDSIPRIMPMNLRKNGRWDRVTP